VVEPIPNQTVHAGVGYTEKEYLNSLMILLAGNLTFKSHGVGGRFNRDGHEVEGGNGCKGIH